MITTRPRKLAGPVDSTNWAVADAALLGHALPSDPSGVKELRRYYLGDQTRTVWQGAASTSQSLRDARTWNICARVVDALTASLNINGATAGPDDAAAAESIQTWTEALPWPMIQQTLFTCAAVDGEAYLIANVGNDNAPTASVNRRWDGTTGLEPLEVDSDGDIRVAQKTWTERYTSATVQAAPKNILARLWARLTGGVPGASSVTVTYRVRYEPDRILRYADDELLDESPWPFDRLPVVRFTSPTGGELTRTIRDLQDDLNDGATDLRKCRRIDALRILYAINLQPSQVDNTVPEGLREVDRQVIEPGTVLWFDSTDTGQNPTFAAIAPGNLDAIMQAMRLTAEVMCYLSRTPSYRLPWNTQAAPPSGRAMQAANREFDSKVRSYQDAFAPGFDHLFRLWQQFGGLTPARVSPAWEAPDYSDAQEDALEVTALQQANVAPEVIMGKLNLTPEEIEKSLVWQAEQQVRQDAAFGAAAAATQAEVGVGAGSVNGLPA